MKDSKPELRELLADVIEASALDLLDPDRLYAIAEDLRVVERRRGYDVGLVAVSVVLSAMQRSTDTEGRLADARRVYEMLGGGPTRESGFRKVARKIWPVLREVLNRRIAGLAADATSPELRGRLSGFRDVLVPDGCGFKLASKLAGTYAGTGTDSQLKLHAVYSVGKSGLTSLHATAGNVHDNEGFSPVWQPGSLYIWDLGYNDYSRVIDATEAGAVVLQRLKDGANPKVLASYGDGGDRRDVHHEDGSAALLNEACALGMVHQQEVLDLDVELRESRRTVIARVVCVPYGGDDRYYLTTLSREEFTPHDVAELYRLRWEIELFFRGLKGAVRLDEVRRLENQASLQTIVYGSLLAAALARDITTKLNELEVTAAETAAADASTEAFPPGADGAGRPAGRARATAESATPAAHIIRRRLAARARISASSRPAQGDGTA